MNKINFTNIVKPYEKELIASIKKFVKIPSFFDPKTANYNMPYGQGINDILIEFSKFGKANGFNVNLTKHYVELSLGHNGKIIEIFGHLDVVPPYNKEQLILKIDGDKIIGRGVSDNKGPFLASFYAVKALKDNNLIDPNVQIKFFAGSDEECGSKCLTKYVEDIGKNNIPTYGFTPDSSFPIVYAEKGCATIIIEKEIQFKNILDIKGGLADNIVISECTFKVKNINDIKDKISVKHKINLENNEIIFIGKEFHGSQPSLGKNAFLIGLKELGSLNNDQNMLDLYENFIDYSGKKMNAYGYGKCLGETTYNIGIVNFHKNKLTLNISFRYPEIDDPKKLVQNITNKLNFNLVHEKYSKVLIHDKKSKLVQLLVKAYREETNDNTDLLTCSGETFAKYCPNVIAFGPEFPNTNLHAHEKNEYISKKNLMKSMAIYAHGVYNLIKDASKI